MKLHFNSKQKNVFNFFRGGVICSKPISYDISLSRFSRGERLFAVPSFPKESSSYRLQGDISLRLIQTQKEIPPFD